jgi:hypothetical protein
MTAAGDIGPTLQHGKRVISPTMGEGTVLMRRPQSGLFLIRFDRDGIEREISGTDLRLARPPVGDTWIGPALGWNTVVIVIGMAIAFIGLARSSTAEIGDSAFRQAVAALWAVQGILGLLIAAIGVLGATIASALFRTRRGL